MAGSATVSRVRDAFERLGRGRQDSVSYRNDAVTLLRRVVPFDGWCWALVDPRTHVPWDALVDNLALPSESQHQQLSTLNLEVNVEGSLRQMIGTHQRVAVLSLATAGDVARSRRWDQVYRSCGVGDELGATLLLDGACWSYLSLIRERGRRRFSADEAHLIRDLLTLLGEGLRRATVFTADVPSVLPVGTALNAPGIVILTSDLQPVAATSIGEQWYQQLEVAHAPTSRPSALLYALAARLKALEAGGDPTLTPQVRTRAANGRWLHVHAARLSGPRAAPGYIAVVVERAQPAEVIPLILRLHGLSARERDITRLLLEGRSTQQIAATLFISPYTVQDHLKSVFAKIGVRSRRELVAAVSGQAA